MKRNRSDQLVKSINVTLWYASQLYYVYCIIILCIYIETIGFNF